MKKLTALILFSVLAAMCARADLIIHELYTYPGQPGTITNLSGGLWILHSGSGNNDAYINGNKEEVSSSSGGNGRAPVRQDDVHRLLSITNNSIYTNAQQVLYTSFIVNFTNLPAGTPVYFAHFYVNSSTFPGRLWAGTNGSSAPNTFRLGISSGSTLSKLDPVDLALNTPYQVVIGYCPVTGDANLADDSTTLWVNPISSTDTGVTSSDAFSPGSSIANSWAFRQASSFGGFLTVSNLSIATTFAEAVTNTMSTNAIPPTIVYQPVGATNFTGSTISLTAVANGQSLANLTYQWQATNTLHLSPINISNPNGNTNVLSVDTSGPQTNYYTLVVTTPYGLSATSAVAQVNIADAPVPPTFTVQPAGMTVYGGQPAGFGATVVGPASGDPVVYTWYSNNVVVTAGQADNGHSSAYTLTAPTTPTTATFYVAATNSYGGRVSSNATLSVIVPPSVSVSYLRQLVDPNNNYQSTNTVLAFQVTGVITTATNLTSGNTASYYLQDATAGIDIFATFGSTFRPAQGDIVTFVGVMSNYSSGLELYADTTDIPYTSYTDVGTGSLPAPVIIPFTITNSGYANMSTNIGGRLVELTNVFFGVNAGTAVAAPATGGYFIPVTNGLGQTFNLEFTAQSLDTQGQIFPAYATSVTGVMFGSMNPSTPVGGVASPNFSVMVTRWADIVVPVLPIPLTTTYSAGAFTFTWGDPSFSLQTSTNLFGPWSTIGGATTGFMTNITSVPATFFRLSHP
jgi:hypothetical protein